MTIQRHWATLGTQDTGRRQTEQKKHNTTQKTKEMSNTKPTISQYCFITGVSSKIDKPRKKYSFMTERRMYSYTTSVSAMSRTERGTNIVGEMISPWGNQLPTMTYGRHSAGAVVLGLF